MEAENFRKLRKKKLENITALSHAVKAERNFNKNIELPRPKDLAKLSDYMKSQIFKPPMKNPSQSTFRRAAEIVQARLLTYNKRPGEVDGIRYV